MLFGFQLGLRQRRRQEPVLLRVYMRFARYIDRSLGVAGTGVCAW